MKGVASGNGPSGQAAQLGVRHRLMRSEGNEVVERGRTACRPFFNDIHHQRQRCRSRAVGDDDQETLAVDTERRQALAHEASNFLVRKIVGCGTASDQT